MRRSLLPVLVGLVASCQGVLVDTYDACEIVGVISAAESAPGDTLRLTGGPFTTTWDTIVQVDGALADVLDVAYEGDCAGCQNCQQDALECSGCDDECADCVQSVGFVVPDAAAGATTVVLTNAFGSTGPIPFTVAGAATIPDTDTDTTGDTDTDTDPPADTDTDTDTDRPTDTDTDTDTTGDTDTGDTGALPADTGDTGAPDTGVTTN